MLSSLAYASQGCSFLRLNSIDRGFSESFEEIRIDTKSILANQKIGKYIGKIENEKIITKCLMNPGTCNKGISTFTNSTGSKFLIKYVKNDSSTVEKLRWFYIISILGVGPKFYGYIEKSDGSIGIVMDFVEGKELFSKSDLVNVYNFATKKTLKDLYTIERLFVLNGIVPSDFQMIVTSAGRVAVIDPDLFLLTKPEVVEPSSYSSDFSNADKEEFLLDIRYYRAMISQYLISVNR